MEQIFRKMREIMDELKEFDEKEKGVILEVLRDWMEDFDTPGGWGDYDIILEQEDYKEIENIQEKYSLPKEKKFTIRRPYDEEIEYDEPNEENLGYAEDDEWILGGST